MNEKFKIVLSNVHEFVEPPDSFWLGHDSSDPELTNDENPVDEVPRKLVNDIDKLIADLEKLFKCRHIIAHEANFSNVSEIELQSFFSATETFIEALYELVDQKLNPISSRHAFGLSIIAGIESAKIYRAMEDHYQQIFELIDPTPTQDQDPIVKESFVKTQNAFLNYLQSEIEFEESINKPISANSLRVIDAWVTSKHCQDRLNRLQEILNNYFKL